MAEHLNEIAAMRLNWMTSLSPEEQAAMGAERAAWEDDATKAERMAELQATFQAADTNNDGLLDRAEFEDFMSKVGQNVAARGVPHMSVDSVDAEMKEKVYAFFDAEDGNVGNGVSMVDFLTCTEKVGQAIMALRQAQ